MGRKSAAKRDHRTLPRAVLVDSHALLPTDRLGALALDELARVLGMPPGSKVRREQIDGGAVSDEWQGYTFDLYGREAPLSELRLGGLGWVLPRLASGARMGLQIWAETVTVAGSSLLGSVHWHPERGKTASIGNLTDPHTQADLLKTDRGLTYLIERTTVRRPGRPPGGTLDNIPIDELGKVYAGLCKTSVKPTRVQFGDALDKKYHELLLAPPSESTIYRRLKSENPPLTWEDFERRYRPETRE